MVGKSGRHEDDTTGTLIPFGQRTWFLISDIPGTYSFITLSFGQISSILNRLFDKYRVLLTSSATFENTHITTFVMSILDPHMIWLISDKAFMSRRNLSKIFLLTAKKRLNFLMKI